MNGWNNYKVIITKREYLFNTLLQALEFAEGKSDCSIFVLSKDHPEEENVYVPLSSDDFDSFVDEIKDIINLIFVYNLD
jgi:hypothetical protein